MRLFQPGRRYRAYANSRFPERSLEELQLLKADVEADEAKPRPDDPKIRDVNRRLGNDAVQRLIADYRSGLHTTQLMTKYSISKSSVLRLLADNHVAMRRKGVSPQQAAEARVLYEEKRMSLAATARQLNLAKQSVRLALLELDVAMRPSGGSRPS